MVSTIRKVKTSRKDAGDGILPQGARGGKPPLTVQCGPYIDKELN